MAVLLLWQFYQNKINSLYGIEFTIVKRLLAKKATRFEWLKIFLEWKIVLRQCIYTFK